MPKFIYGVHIMWYEIEMLKEHFDSLRHAIEHATWPVEIHICINLQTYIETPIIEYKLVCSDFNIALQSCIKEFPSTMLTVNTKTPYDSFYNIGDFRRELTNDNGYVIWGEIDAILPTQYFAILEQIYDTPGAHVVSFASRKMWDSSWVPVEHFSLQDTSIDQVVAPFRNEDYITQIELNNFNDAFAPSFIQLHTSKIDGCLLAIKDGVPPLIPENMHFSREDYVAQLALEIYKIPQLHVGTILKGHNYRHPRKRVATIDTRSSSIYEKYETESIDAGKQFIKQLMGIDPSVEFV